MRGCFVTGTDTGAGKTVLAAAVLAALRARGIDAVGLKPVLTGTDEATDPRWPPDHELLAAVSGARGADVTVAGYGPPVSPHLAAELSGMPVEPARLLGAIRAAAAAREAVIVEGVGGLLVPLSDTYLVADLAAEVGLPVLVAARAGLGTINHTLLTVEAARRRGLPVRGVVLGPWPPAPGPLELSNQATIARLGEVEVATLPWLEAPDPEALARAGDGLPLARWLSGSGP